MRCPECGNPNGIPGTICDRCKRGVFPRVPECDHCGETAWRGIARASFTAYADADECTLEYLDVKDVVVHCANCNEDSNQDAVEWFTTELEGGVFV